MFVPKKPNNSLYSQKKTMLDEMFQQNATKFVHTYGICISFILSMNGIFLKCFCWNISLSINLLFLKSEFLYDMNAQKLKIKVICIISDGLGIQNLVLHMFGSVFFAIRLYKEPSFFYKISSNMEKYWQKMLCSTCFTHH